MELTEIGYFSKTHGIKGHLILKSEADFYFEDVTALFIETAGSKAPYFISEIKEIKNDLVVLLEEVSSVEKAKLLTGKKVFVDSQLVEEAVGAEDWAGFEIIDSELGSLGTITEMSDNGVQVLASIRYKDKDVILPMVEDFIERIDEAAKKIYYKAPDGLVQLYLDEK